MAVDRGLGTKAKNGHGKKDTVKILHQIIEVLDKFSDDYDKRLNFEKLASHLNLSSSKADDLLSVIIHFQELFTQTLTGYVLQKKIVNNQLYVVTKKNQILNHIPKKVIMNKIQLNLLSDVIYLFKFVKKGKGFDVAANGTDLLRNIKDLCDYYPFLFQQQNGCLYPSEFGLQLGELLLSYKKSNKQINLLQLDDCEVYMTE
jgi:hypothetical protein